MDCPFGRYYVCHAAVSVALSVVGAGLLGVVGSLAGPVFYTGRELVQYYVTKKGEPFDVKGLVGGLAGLAVTLLVL